MYYSDSFADALCGDGLGREFVLVFAAMSGKQVDAGCTGITGQFHIMRMIAKNKGFLKVDTVFLSGLMQVVRVGFNAFTVVFEVVRAAVYFLDTNACICQVIGHMAIDSLCLLSGNQPFGNAGLMGDYKEQGMLLEFQQSGNRVREEEYLLRSTQMSLIFDDGSVVVQEYGFVFVDIFLSHCLITCCWSGL